MVGVLSNIYVLFVKRGLKNVMNAWNEKRNKHSYQKNDFEFSYYFCFYKFVTDIDLDSC